MGPILLVSAPTPLICYEILTYTYNYFIIMTAVIVLKTPFLSFPNIYVYFTDGRCILVILFFKSDRITRYGTYIKTILVYFL